MRNKSQQPIVDYISATIRERINELGISPYALTVLCKGFATRPSVYRVVNGSGVSSIAIINAILNVVGLELKIVKKEHEKADYKKGEE